MSDKLHQEQVVDKNTAWWTAHPNFKPSIGDADSLAKSVVHWHHNVESSRRFKGTEAAKSDEFFLRQYAIGATGAWLAEAQAELDAMQSTPETWYQRRDLEVLIRTLQSALDNFEWNTKNPQGKP